MPLPARRVVQGGGGPPPNPTASQPPAGGNGSLYPGGQVTLGQPMFPWLMPYQGQFTSPMSPYQNQALEGMSQFLTGMQSGGGSSSNGGGSSWGGSVGHGGSNYNPPDFSGVTDALGTLHSDQDALNHQKIASSMAAGGNALSGARLASDQQYQNTSDANFNSQIGQLLNQNYQFGADLGVRNRAIDAQMAGISAQANAARRQNELARQGLQMGGYEQLMQMGGIPQQLGQHDLNSQYADYLRQIGGMEQAYGSGPNTALGTLSHGYNQGSHTPSYGASDLEKTMGMLQLLTGGGNGGIVGGLGSLLSKLFSGGGGNSGAGGGTGGTDLSQEDLDFLLNGFGGDTSGGGTGASGFDYGSGDTIPQGSVSTDWSATYDPYQDWASYMDQYYQGGGT